MKPVKLFKNLITVMLVLAVSTIIANLSAQEKKHTPKPLTKDQMEMMKKGPMKNMDKFMSSQETMMKILPKRLKDAQEATIKYGDKLFNDTKALSTNGQACASCHPGGGTLGGEAKTPMRSEVTGKPYKIPIPTLIGSAATFPKFKIPNDAVITVGDMSNNCIMMFMAAQPLDPKSYEFRALTTYVTSLSNDEKVSVGKMPEMMKK